MLFADLAKFWCDGELFDRDSYNGFSQCRRACETGYEWLATEHNQIPTPLDAYSAIRLPVPSEWVTS